MDDEQQRDLARTLRAQLEHVIPDERARRAAAAELDEALALPRPESDRRLTEVLRARAETRAWMRERDPDAETVRIIGLAGDASELGTYFVCPYDDYDFVREHVSDEVPLCPVHKVALEPMRE